MMKINNGRVQLSVDIENYVCIEGALFLNLIKACADLKQLKNSSSETVREICWKDFKKAYKAYRSFKLNAENEPLNRFNAEMAKALKIAMRK